MIWFMRMLGSAQNNRVIAALVVVALLASCDRSRLDENLCAVGQSPAGSTILLLDTSDPLSAQHQAELRRLLREMNPEFEQQSGSDFYIAPREELVVYELVEDVSELRPSLRLCNPGQNPNTWEWWRELVEGRAIAMRRWQQFGTTIESMFANDESSPQSSSPILEALGVIVPLHAPSQRVMADASYPIHLILYSDLLQHSEALSHYGPYPPAEDLLDTPALRHLGTSLAGIEVSIYRLERGRDARWQTVDHYYWWTNLIEEFGGQVISQESI